MQVSEKTKESHWEQIYGTKYADAVSWYTPHLTRSLELIAEAALPLDAHIIDVGGGASTLTADLLERGYQNLTVLDLSAQFGSDFERLHCLEERHETPWGSEQAFVYCLCRRRDGVDPGKSRFDRL